MSLPAPLLPFPALTAAPFRTCSKVISPVFEKLADTFPALAFYKVDVDVQEVSQPLESSSGILWARSGKGLAWSRKLYE